MNFVLTVRGTGIQFFREKEGNMTEIPDNLKAAMKQYDSISRKLDNDPVTRSLWAEMEAIGRQADAIEAQITDIEAPHREQLSQLEDYIKAQVLELGASCEHAGVTARHRKGYERTTWNNKEMTSLCMKNPALLDLLGSARKVSEVEPSVTISYEKPKEETADAVPF